MGGREKITGKGPKKKSYPFARKISTTIVEEEEEEAKEEVG
jgi:hypothetical protein